MNNRAKMAQVPLGMRSDAVLKLWGRGLRSKTLGVDDDPRGMMLGRRGYAMEWEYPWGFLVFKRRRWGDDGAHCYRVVEKREK